MDKNLVPKSFNFVEKWSLKALENSLELELMESFNFNSFNVVLLVRREVRSLMVSVKLN